MYAVAVGEMFDGINFYGPFETYEDAEKWAAIESDYSWWVVVLSAPKEA